MKDVDPCALSLAPCAYIYLQNWQVLLKFIVGHLGAEAIPLDLLVSKDLVEDVIP
jgi:hypothetical protein